MSSKLQREVCCVSILVPIFNLLSLVSLVQTLVPISVSVLAKIAFFPGNGTDNSKNGVSEGGH